MEKSKKHAFRETIPFRRYFPLIFLVVVGVAGSFYMFSRVSSWEQTNSRDEFESHVNAYSNAIELNINSYVGALLFLGDYFNNSSFVTREEFKGVVKRLLPRYPGIQNINWLPLVKDDQRSNYESLAREVGFENFEFTELTESKELVRASRREEYIVVYYMYPLQGNIEALGYDIASDKTRLKAIVKGFNTGKISATERITLIQETGNQYGILLLHPIYDHDVPLNTPEERHKTRKGFVVLVLRIGQAIETALKGFPDKGISLTLYDMSADEGKRLLFHRPSRISKTPDPLIPEEGIQKGFFSSKTINFEESQWKIVFSPSDLYFHSHKIWESWAVLLGSLLFTSLLARYMFKRILYTTEIEQRIKKQEETNQILQNEIKVRIKAEVELDKSVSNLQHALDEVNKLRGILPICASCKQIRDDKGSWSQVEIYIRDHSEAEFSHSICPKCAKELYPGFYNSKVEDT